MRQTQTFTGTLCVMRCPMCGVIYGLERGFREALRMEGDDWYCPNGDLLTFGDSEVKRLKRQIERAEKDAGYYRDAQRLEQSQHAATRRREAAQKAAKTRLKNRIAKGVCPSCNRHFANVEQHMRTQHGADLEGEKP